MYIAIKIMWYWDFRHDFHQRL